LLTDEQRENADRLNLWEKVEVGLI